MRAAAIAALLAAAGCRTAPPVPAPAAARAPAPPPVEKKAPSRTDARRAALLERLGGPASFSDLLTPDPLDGPLLAGQALEAYADGRELEAVLRAQAALGADPGNGARRRLLKSLGELTGIPPDPDGILPLSALVQHELAGAEAAFFERRYGAALQACRRALLLSPGDPRAWTRLGSSFYALGDEARARDAWAKAGPAADPALARFLKEKGWSQ